VTSISYPAANAENVTYSYDSTAGGNFGLGRLTGVTDQSGSTSMVYDALGRITSETRVIGSQSYTTVYAYDAADHLTEITYPSGRIVTYARNALGQVSSVTTKQNALAANDNVATGVTWKPMSDLLSSLTHGSGLATTAGYDLDYRLTSLLVQDGGTNISSLSYTYTDGMNLTAVNDNVTPANSASLSYSPANRLATANGAWGNGSFTYDGVGNRTSDVNTVSGVTTTRLAAYDTVSNRITGMTENSAALRSYTYDNGGNILTDTRPGEVFAFTYNARNRPASVTRNSVAYATYGYNAFEQLVSRSTSAAGGPSGTVHYIHDRDGHIIAEADAATGQTSREYIWMAANDNEPTDLPLAVVDDVTTTPVLLMVHTDHLGRPIIMTDATKATVWQASYKPWGEPLSISGTRAFNLRFPGQYFQIETSLAYNWHRHYDTTTGRYTQPDPLGFVDGPSIYAYAGNSPFMSVDRDGRCEVACAIVVTAAVGAAIGIAIEYFTNGDCATWGDYLVAAAGGAVGGVGGRFSHLPLKLIGRSFEKSHWFAARFFKPGNRVWWPPRKFNPRLPRWLDGHWNRNHVSPWRHYKHDNFRYPKGNKNWGDKWGNFAQQIDRVPDWIKGAIGGGSVGSAYDGGDR
jgi:RHS repeat-associated protein